MSDKYELRWYTLEQTPAARLDLSLVHLYKTIPRSSVDFDPLIETSVNGSVFVILPPALATGGLFASIDDYWECK